MPYVVKHAVSGLYLKRQVKNNQWVGLLDGATVFDSLGGAKRHARAQNIRVQEVCLLPWGSPSDILDVG